MLGLTDRLERDTGSRTYPPGPTVQALAEPRRACRKSQVPLTRDRNDEDQTKSLACS